MVDIDFDELCGIAIARLRVSVIEFYEMSPVEFYYAIKTCNERELSEFKTLFEVERWGLKHHWNMQGKKVKRTIKEVKDVEKFTWDCPKKALKQNQTVEEMKQELISIFNTFRKKR